MVHAVSLAEHSLNYSDAATAGAIDYKYTFADGYSSEEERQLAYSECHTRSAKRVLQALLANGGANTFLQQKLRLITICL